ncbi:thymidine kinase 2, mitochondrial-like [Physella acuta]|uniref:thymidine kinase 2, mitochondrial-like n=1 Tax=Physella acuta TaxID=109671 RepID=UPI0027DD4279|nr:thymidine kinase 2, mitochondrial-like [Physella acuta]
MHMFLKCLRNIPFKLHHCFTLQSRSFSITGTGSMSEMSAPQPLKKQRNSNRNIIFRPEDTEDDFNEHACKKVYEKINNENNFVVCVEGNISCGKTTLLNYFKDIPTCEVIIEPVEKWRNVNGFNALDLMYKDPQRWGMALQTYIQLTMLQSHKNSQNAPVKLMERSIYSAKYCFVDNLYKSAKMPEIEHIILTEWFNWIIKTQNIKVDLFVYLRTNPELLYSRIVKRCRNEELKISLDYLKTLHQLHDDWLIHKKYDVPAEVLVIDANSSIEEMQISYEKHKNRIVAVHTS